MKKVINNEGTSINVSEATFQAMQQEFNEGGWAVLVNSAEGRPNMVILQDNFSY